MTAAGPAWPNPRIVTVIVRRELRNPAEPAKIYSERASDFFLATFSSAGVVVSGVPVCMIMAVVLATFWFQIGRTERSRLAVIEVRVRLPASESLPICSMF